ncbi:MAG: hypothetical protein IPP90_06800 [Gemmatimonadaceae bacterium]|nr:hypothetical protein [Gemmatimonadaceae bacterium]
MRPPDVAFLIALLTTLVVAIRVAWHLVRGQRASTLRLGRRWGLGAACYIVVLLAVSLFQPGRTLSPGENECFDDWCIAVDESARTVPERITVEVRLSNRGRGRPQAEPDAYVYLMADGGHVVQAKSIEHRDSIGGVVPAGESRTVRVMFDVPPQLVVRGLVKARRSRFPASFIIGDPSSWLHRPTIHTLARKGPR